MAFVVRVKRRVTNQAVNAGFRAQQAVGVFAFNADGGAVDARDFAVVFFEDVDFEAFALGVAAVHAEQIAGEQGGFVTAGAGADFQEHVAGIKRVGRQQQALELLLEFDEFGLGGLRLFHGQGAEGGLRVLAQLIGFGKALFGGLAGMKGRHQVLQPGIFPAQGAELGGVGQHCGFGQQRGDFPVTVAQSFQLGGKAGGDVHGSGSSRSNRRRASSIRSCWD